MSPVSFQGYGDDSLWSQQEWLCLRKTRERCSWITLLGFETTSYHSFSLLVCKSSLSAQHMTGTM